MKFKSFGFLLIASTLFLTISCDEEYTPKPRGYFRISLPQKTYISYDSDCPFTFNYPTYAKVVKDSSINSQPCWINIEYPNFKGQLHLSYKAIHGKPEQFFEESRTLAYKHTVKADAINENIIRKNNSVYGVLYEMEGNAASSMQFYLTDSTHHFLRGALYFSVPPNSDSLAPVISFVQQDIYKMIDSFTWK